MQLRFLGLGHLCFASLGLGFSAFLGFLEAIAVGLNLDDLSAMGEPVDEGDGAGGVGEDLGPFAERLVGGVLVQTPLWAEMARKVG